MFDLICALGLGVVFGILLKKEQHPPVVIELQEKVKKLEEDVAYYKDLCKWHAERNNTSWDNFKMNKDIQ
jgi:hypothetical protein